MISAVFIQALITFIMAASLSAHGQIIGDRVLFEVNNTPYTQRQFEAHAIIKNALKAESKKLYQALERRNWEEQLDQFMIDMVILGEAERLGGFRAAAPLIEASLSVLAERTNAYPRLRADFDRLGVTDKLKRTNIGSIMRIEAFRRSRDKQASAINKPGAALAFDRVHWLEELKNRVIVRTFEDAKVYKSIEPAAARRK